MGAFWNTESNIQQEDKFGNDHDVDEKDNTHHKEQRLLDSKEFEWTKDKNVTQGLEFEKWYHILSDYTMKSIIIDCSKEEINAIKDACDVHRDEVIDADKAKLTPKVQNILDSFATKIQKYIDDNNWHEGIFVRFSERSPKDAVLKIEQDKFDKIVAINTENVYKLQKYSEKLEEMKFDADAIVTNSIIRGMTQAWSSTLCVKSGKEAVNLIIHSDRVFTDFCLGELMIENYNPKLIIREFNHNIDFEYEFRTFVFKGNLTAITQYNHFIYLRKIIDNKDEIKNVIYLFWKNKIHVNMSKNNILSYVMDVALVKTGENKFELVLIEINPFWTKAGALLFDWKKDVKVMTCTEPKDIEFRVLKQPYDSKPPKFNSSLFALFDNLFQKMKTN